MKWLENFKILKKKEVIEPIKPIDTSIYNIEIKKVNIINIKFKE
jgi:hypothetical protein